MSEPAAQQGAPTTAAPPTPPPAPAGEGSAPPNPQSPPGAAAAATAAESKADAAQEALDAAKQKPGETNAEYETRISKLTREARQARSEVDRLKAALSERDERLKQFDEQMKQAKSKRWTKRDYISLTRAVNEANGDENKLRELFDPDEGLDDLPKSVRDEIIASRKEREERQAREQQQQFQAQHTREVGIVDGRIKALAETYPLFELMPGSAEHILSEWHDRWESSKRTVKPDVDELIAEMHAPLVKNLAAALQSERSRSFLLKAHPELKALFAGQEVGPTNSPERNTQGAGRGTGPAAVTQPPATPPAPPAAQPVQHRLLDEERRTQSVMDAYREYQRSVRKPA